MVKKAATALLIAMFVCASGSRLSPVSAVHADATEAVLRVCVYDNAPFSSWDANGRPQGFFVDIWEALARKASVAYSYEKSTFAGCLERIGKGYSDVALAFADTADRRNYLEFLASPVFHNWATVYSRRNHAVSSLPDLQGKTIAIEKGDVYGAEFRRLADSFGLKVTIIEAESFEDVFQHIRDRRAYAGVVSRSFGVHNASRFGISRTQVVFYPIPVGIAFRHGGHRVLQERMSDELDALIRDDTSVYHAAFMKWMGGGQPSDRSTWFYFAIGTAVAACLLAGGIAYVFRRQLQLKAVEIRKQEERFRAIFDASNDAVFTIKEGLISECNLTTLSMFACADRSEIIGRSLEDFSPPRQPDGMPSSAERARNALCAALAGSIQRFECQRRRLDGSLFDAEVVLNAVDLAGDRQVLAVVRDITARKIHERRLLETTSLLRTIVDNAPTPILMLDVDYRVLIWNPAAARVYGWSAEEVLGKPMPYLDGEEKMRVQKEIDTAFERGEPAVYESCRKTSSGADLTVLAASAPVRGADGGYYGIVGVHIDITEQKRAHEALDQERIFLNAILDSIPGMIYLFNEEGRLVRWNRKFYELGYSDEELNGSHYLDWFQGIGSDTAKAQLTVDQIMAEGKGDAEVRVAGKNGRIRDYFVSGVRLTIDGKPYFTGIGIDISARKKAEEELLRLATAIEQAEEEVVITDTRGVIQYVNPAFEKVTGYSRAEAIGRTPAILKSNAHDRQFYEHLWKTITCGGVWKGRFRNKRKDGSLFYEDAVISPIVDSAGTISGFVSLKRDITDDLQREAQLIQAQKMDAVGRLAGGVAHDFNNLLTAILGYAAFITDLAKTPEKKDSYARRISDVANRAASLTRSLLVFSRKQESDFSRVNIHDVVNDFLKLIGRIIGEDIRITTRMEGASLPVMGNAGQLGQILLNLATNARDAMPHGGTISITAQKGEVDDACARAHGGDAGWPAIVLSVADTGCGIPREQLKDIFEPFFTTKEAGKGTGLGLAIVFGIARSHGGFVDVSSEPGVGSIFRIYLPVCLQDEASEHEQTPGLPLGGTETILLAEDDELIHEILVETLKNAGYHVLACRSGVEAATLFQEHGEKVALILSDVMMPKMNGKELYQKITSARPNAKFLFLSGYTSDILEDRLNFAMPVHVLYKPVSPLQLLRKIRSVLDS